MVKVKPLKASKSNISVKNNVRDREKLSIDKNYHKFIYFFI